MNNTLKKATPTLEELAFVENKPSIVGLRERWMTTNATSDPFIAKKMAQKILRRYGVLGSISFVILMTELVLLALGSIGTSHLITAPTTAFVLLPLIATIVGAVGSLATLTDSRMLLANAYLQDFISLSDLFERPDFRAMFDLARSGEAIAEVLSNWGKKKLTSIAFEILKLQDAGEWTAADGVKEKKLKPLHDTLLRFGLANPKWDCYFAAARCVLDEQKKALGT